MTLAQEAYALIKKQPDENIRLVIELLKRMDPISSVSQTEIFSQPRELGLAKEAFKLSDDFDETFDAMDADVAELFEEAIESDKIFA